MKDRGRQIVPWFQTSIAITLFMAISAVLAIKLLFGENLNGNTLSELTFIPGFLLGGGVCFFSIKRYFFDNGKYLTLSEKYVNRFTPQKRLVHKTVSILLIIAVPVFLGYLLWLNAKPL